ncbi:MAG: hypothetical protein QXX23_06995 [Thermoplasmata archaeon]
MVYTITSGSMPAMAPLTQDEQNALASSLEVLSFIPGKYRDLGELVTTYSSLISDFVQYAKADLNMPFGGLLPKAGQFGIRFLRAETALATYYNGAAQTTPSLTWLQSVSAGWQKLFFVNLNISGAAGYPATQLQNNYNVAIFGILDPTPFEKIQEYQIKLAGSTYPVIPATVTQISDLSYIPFPGMIYLAKNQSVEIDAYFSTATQFAGRLFGIEAVVQSLAIDQQ